MFIFVVYNTTFSLIYCVNPALGVACIVLMKKMFYLKYFVKVFNVMIARRLQVE